MQVSVIVPAFNHSHFIRAALDSVFAQTIQAAEVIVVNDGSPDDTADVLKPLIEAGRIRYIEQSNAGQATARNRGLREAKGEFVAFLDDDDLWPSDKLHWQVSFLQSNLEADVVAGTVSTIDPHGQLKRSHTCRPGDLSFADLFVGCPIWSPGQTLIRRSALEEVNGFSEDILGADDLDLWMKLTSRHRHLVMCDRLSLLYREHSSNASSNSQLMLSNLDIVIQRHLDNLEIQPRRQLEKAVYRWLYNYLGKRTIGEIGSAVKTRAPLAAWAKLRSMRPFFCRLRRDPQLAKFIARDVRKLLQTGCV